MFSRLVDPDITEEGVLKFVCECVFCVFLVTGAENAKYLIEG